MFISYENWLTFDTYIFVIWAIYLQLSLRDMKPAGFLVLKLTRSQIYFSMIEHPMSTLTNIKSQKLRRSFALNAFESLYTCSVTENMNRFSKCKFCFIEKYAELHQSVTFRIDDYSQNVIPKILLLPLV